MAVPAFPAALGVATKRYLPRLSRRFARRPVNFNLF
jgi:hypothetical protein